MNFMGGFLQIFAPLAIALLDAWLKRKDKENKMTQSFYDFLKQVDNSGALKVSNYLASEELLKQTQEQLKKNNEISKGGSQ